MTKLSSLLSGIIFGLGLTISGMVNPQKVLGFLNIFGDWDPSLMFVMVGAIIIFSPLHFTFKRKSRPFFAQSFIIPSKKDIDKSLILGAILFGIGWGLVGLCPGPAISAISFLNINVYIFVLFMFIGFYLGNLLLLKK
ncbi:MAG TPA: DUF6691 family protein [Candidatus Pelagibacter bacterium]|jgi:hypothetical protein|nr:DUF6691 family protein [Candidatus Pelagibacter bacterium]|tara:strand:- start:50 stop:463 length:414 start_codon:yes stop_codon:yes gene_type:complete